MTLKDSEDQQDPCANSGSSRTHRLPQSLKIELHICVVSDFRASERHEKWQRLPPRTHGSYTSKNYKFRQQFSFMSTITICRPRLYFDFFFPFLGERPGRRRIVQKNSSSQGSGKGQVCDESRGMRGRSHGGAGGPRGLSSDWMDVVVIDSFCAGCQGGSLQLKELARDIWQERDSQILGARWQCSL